MGCQDDFEFAQEFASHTDIGPDSEVTLLWEGSCAAWNIDNVRTNSALNLFTHDLAQKSRQAFFFNDTGRDLVLEAAPNEPWAGPAGGGSQ